MARTITGETKKTKNQNKRERASPSRGRKTKDKKNHNPFQLAKDIPLTIPQVL
jgi:hypothetical protein